MTLVEDEWGGGNGGPILKVVTVPSVRPALPRKLQMFSENTPPKSARGGRLVKYKGRVVSFAPMMLMASASALALTIGVVQAAVISTPQTTEQVLTNEDNSITSTVTIDATTDVEAVTCLRITALPSRTTGRSSLMQMMTVISAVSMWMAIFWGRLSITI